jgi:hypothetical protein
MTKGEHQMTQVKVRIHSVEGIETEIEGLGTGKLTAERQPKIGTRGGMGFGVAKSCASR